VGLLAGTLLGTGCAGSYRAIRPDRIATYQSSPTNAPLQFSYQFDALRLQGAIKNTLRKS